MTRFIRVVLYGYNSSECVAFSCFFLNYKKSICKGRNTGREEMNNRSWKVNYLTAVGSRVPSRQEGNRKLIILKGAAIGQS